MRCHSETEHGLTVTEFVESRQRTSRKERKCDLCGKMIQRGLEFVNVKGRKDGKFFQEVYHIHCDALIDAYCFDNGVDEFETNDVNAWVAESCEGCKMIAECLEKCDAIQECTEVLRRCLGRKYTGTVRDSVENTIRLRRIKQE